MKIVFMTCMHGRYKIFNAFANAIKKLGDYPVVVVGSEGELSRKAVEKHGFIYQEHPNQPLGAKFNYAMLKCKELNPDFVITLGSDDLITLPLMNKIIDLMGKGFDFIGITDFYFYNLPTKKLFYWNGYDNHRKGETCGAGRVLSKTLLNRIDWKPWSENVVAKGLDGSMSRKLSGTNYTQKSISLKDEGLFAVDIKSSESITSINSIPKEIADSQLIIDYFNEDIRALHSI